MSVSGLITGCARNEPSPGRLAGKSGANSSYDSKLGVSASRRVVPHQTGVAKRKSVLSRELPGGRVPKGGGSYKLGNRYKIAGKWYVPKLDPNYNKSGTASWYGDDFHGRKTANGEIYDMNALSAAHPTMPLPSYAYVTNLANGRTVLVRVNDRGPYAHGRIIDLSRTAATALDYKGKGLARVRVRYVGRAPMNGSEARERRFLANQRWYRGRGQRTGARYAGLPARGSNRESSRDSQPAPQATGRTPTWNWQPGRATATAVAAGYANNTQAPTHYNQNRPPRYGLGRNTRYGSGRATQTGTVSVQAGTFMVRANAERMRNRLAGLGRVVIDPVRLPGGTGYRVSVGPVSARKGYVLRSAMISRGVVAPLTVRQ